MRQIPFNKKVRLAARQFFIPKDSLPVTHPDTDSIVYVYGLPGQLAAVAFRSTAGKPAWHYIFRSPEHCGKYVRDWLTKEAEQSARKADRKTKAAQARANFVNPYKVGDILHSSWGYDQTNVEFFQVVEVGATTIVIREIAGDCKETGFMSGTTTAQPNNFIGEPIHRTIHIGVGCDGKVFHNVRSPIYGNLYSGGLSHECSWYA